MDRSGDRGGGHPSLWPVISLSSPGLTRGSRAAPPRGKDRWLALGPGVWPGVWAGGFGEPGGDLLFHVLRRSTIGAEGFHGRVRDGIGCLAPRCGHQAGQASMRPRAPQRRSWPKRAPGGFLVHGLDRWIGSGPGLPGGICECGGGSVGSAAARRDGACRCTPAVFPLSSWRWSSVRIGRVRAISTGQLRGLLRFHLRPIDVVVFHGSRRDLVLRRVSRLDAFSGYPVRT